MAGIVDAEVHARDKFEHGRGNGGSAVLHGGRGGERGGERGGDRRNNDRRGGGNDRGGDRRGGNNRR